MDPSHHIICHRNDMCQELINDLPETHTNHFTIHWVDNTPLETVHPHIHKTIMTKRTDEQTNPDKKHGPAVMFYDEASESYIQHTGVKAIQFLHNYKMSDVTNKMNKRKSNAGLQSKSVHQNSKNINAILNIHNNHIPKITQSLHDSLHKINHEIKYPISSSLTNNINDITRLELQRLYSKMAQNHVPFKDE